MTGAWGEEKRELITFGEKKNLRAGVTPPACA